MTAKAFLPEATEVYVSRLQSLPTPPPNMTGRIRQGLARATGVDEREILTRWKKESVPEDFRLAGEDERQGPKDESVLGRVIASIRALAEANGLDENEVAEVADKLLSGGDEAAARHLLGMAKRLPASQKAVERRRSAKGGS